MEKKWIGIVELKLELGFCLELFDTIYALSMRQSLISFSWPDKLITLVLLVNICFS